MSVGGVVDEIREASVVDREIPPRCSQAMGSACTSSAVNGVAESGRCGKKRYDKQTTSSSAREEHQRQLQHRRSCEGVASQRSANGSSRLKLHPSGYIPCSSSSSKAPPSSAGSAACASGGSRKFYGAGVTGGGGGGERVRGGSALSGRDVRAAAAEKRQQEDATRGGVAKQRIELMRKREKQEVEEIKKGWNAQRSDDVMRMYDD